MMEFTVMRDPKPDEQRLRTMYHRGTEVWVERASDQPVRPCMPMCEDGYANETDVLRLCERIS